jgi:hypothetical protein
MRRVGSVLLFLLPAVALMAAEKRPEAGLINTVDRTFQSRFEKIDLKVFGMRRIPVTPEHDEFNRFSPENAEDRRVTTALTESGWEGAFFVAGRKALHWAIALKDYRERRAKEEAPDPNDRSEAFHSHAVSKAIRLNPPVKGTPRLPTQTALLLRVGDSLKHFAAKEPSYEFKEAGWLVVARPIPASKVACLKCHQKDEAGKALKLGDPLGIAFYAFARAGEEKAMQQAAQPVKARSKQQTGSLR